ncbi:Aste57867_15652 [Aphanomyces stellatus]|uniref:Aste57867_15652 protein n=1 Tax=Aphanomyces stellatus TaxID=120398 RepID=A0A485L5I0_9STRA|nr:hypothetical protein As57867_015596 [Aphanomyces stellatus]VFT92448.1 Aste57867_15652 [Aphanomyces stellatus]
MTMDIICNTSYTVVALFRVCQLQDLWQFVLGSFCGSNFVWASYAAMRFSTVAIKRFRWEAHFEPLDASMMTLTSAFYAGPMLFMISHTPLVMVFQFLVQVLPTKKMEAIEVSVGMSTFLLMFASVPFLQAAVARTIFKSQQRKHRKTIPATRFDTIRYNDWKYLFFHVWFDPALQAASKFGGTLYQLFDQEPQYRKFPLFSSRGSDCFVRQVDIQNGRIVGQYRLSLLHGLDFHAKDSSLRIATCTDPHLAKAICVCDGNVCNDVESLNNHKFVLHSGACNCCWLL